MHESSLTLWDNSEGTCYPYFPLTSISLVAEQNRLAKKHEQICFGNDWSSLGLRLQEKASIQLSTKALRFPFADQPNIACRLVNSNVNLEISQ